MNPLSLTPRFSGVYGQASDWNRFSGLRSAIETAEAVQAFFGAKITPLKRGVNETASCDARIAGKPRRFTRRSKTKTVLIGTEKLVRYA
jgi:hypothetical protein